MSGQTYRLHVRLSLSVGTLALLMSSPVLGKIIYVDDDAPPGPHDASST